MCHRSFSQVLAIIVLVFAFIAGDNAQTVGPRALITQPIDEHHLVRLAGNTRPEANRRNDLGAVRDDFHLDMYLQLKRSPQQELAAAQFVESLTEKSSPNFHKWISAAEYGQRFGAASEDMTTVSRWLQSHGFTVNQVAANNMVIDFSGNARQVREAFHTEIHNVQVAGQPHFANMSDPQIPASLLPAVAGVVSLNNFMPHPMLVPRTQYTVSPTTHPLVPNDLATIYNLAPAFSGGFTGEGQSIVVVEDTDLFNGTADWSVFRQTFGLASQFPNGTLTQVHPAPGTAGSCNDPGVNGDSVEAALDVEWASAAAPNAAILMASCSDTTNFGGFIALQNMLTNGGPLPSVVSISYGESETQTGAALNSYINTLYQTAAAAGVSVFVSSGDSAAAASDRDGVAAIYGIGVSGWASTPYNVAVGGTDFADYAAGTTSTFWNATNGPAYDSAKSYIPEIPWNDSCGSSVAANFSGFSTSYGPAGYCNAYPDFSNTIGGSGGPSGCATGARSIDYVVSGTCAGYAKPSWQSIFGNPGDGVRDLPDVSLFASNGFWGHYYVLCFSAAASCSGAPSTWYGVGGTSASSPIMAGIQALINQALGAKNVGNPNPVYYQIGQNEYSTDAGRAACNSSTNPVSTCSFNDVTFGDMVLPCAGTFNCFLNGEALGALSTSDTSYAPAYAASPGWDFATGIGTVNAFNLLNAFVDSIAPSTAPAAPVLVSPANGASGVLPTTALTWNASAGATSYDVYLGTSSTPPLLTSTSNIAYTPLALSPGATYYWAIGARNSLGANASAPWSFTTNCVAALNPSSITVPAAGFTGTIAITATAGCSWTAGSTVAWITITSGSSGSGNGTIGYTVAPAVGAQRIGAITIAGQTFTITQAFYPVISTLAGGALPATTAPGASLSIPVQFGIATDAAGNVYFPSPNLNLVFKADPSGVVTRIAGTGVLGSSGDKGPALGAQLNQPNGVAVDAAGNVYIADTQNFRIRKVDGSGTITTVAGTGICCGYTGDGGDATGAEIGIPYGLAIDAAGNLYISDVNNNVVRKVTAAGTISTVAGNGTSGFLGDGGPAINAELRQPFGLAVDGAGNLYIADSSNYRIRMVPASSGNITTVAGNGGCCFNGDGLATNAELDIPGGVAVDTSGNIYIADTYNNRIRKVTNGAITTIAGGATYGFLGDGSIATSALLADPTGVAVDSSGNLYVADQGNARVRKISATGGITTFVGGGLGDGALAPFGSLSQPSGVVRDNAGNTYISDTNNNLVRKVAPDGTITTIAGTGAAGSSGDGGPAASAQLFNPRGLALDSSGNLYIADTYNLRVRKVDASGNISTVAGNGICCYNGDGGLATSAELYNPSAVAVDASGYLYIADTNNNRIRRVTNGTIATYAGNGTYGYSGDGAIASSAELRYPSAVALDSAGNLYIADRNNNRIRIVSAAKGIITTVAGNGNCCFSGDGGPAIGAELNSPAGVALDSAGNLYIADTYNERIREVTNGTINTVAGTGTYGYSGDGAPATGATLRSPFAISVDASNNIAIADQGSNAVRLLTPAGTQPVLTVLGTHSGSFSAASTGAYTVTVSNAATAGATVGTVTVTDSLPATLTLVSMSGSGWTCSANSCTRGDALNGGSSYPPITVMVNASGAQSQVTNLVSVSGGGSAVGGSEDLTTIIAVAPAISLVANAESGSPTIAPNTWVEIKGLNLAPSGDSRIWQGSDFATGQMPTELDGVRATVNGKSAYIYFISPAQVNILTPPDALSGTVQIQVSLNGTPSAAFSAQAQSESPSFFVFNGGPYVAATHADGSLIGPTSLYAGATTPAQPGETIIVYANGFGATTVPVVSGSPSQSGTLSPLPVILIGGVQATVKFAGLNLTPGEFQFNVVVPALADGDQSIGATFNGLGTQSGTLLAVHQ